METIIRMLKKMGNDVDYSIYNDKEIGKNLIITINDFEGFDEDGSEVMRDYDIEAVETLLEWLEKHCVSEDNADSLYHEYKFENFYVQFGYSSYDI